MSKAIPVLKPTTKDIFAERIAKEIFNYRKTFGILTFTVKFNSGVAASLVITSEEKINISTLHDKNDYKAAKKKQGE
jgi:hypothetical protein